MKKLLAIILTLALLLCTVLVGAVSEGDEWTCPNCGRKGLTGKFCGTCGTSKPEVTTDIWTCPNCGLEGNTGNFCPECAAPRPVIALDDGKWICPACGFADNMGKFCTECATPRPAESRQTNGAKLPEPVEGVNCRLCNHSLVIKDDCALTREQILFWIGEDKGYSVYGLTGLEHIGYDAANLFEETDAGIADILNKLSELEPLYIVYAGDDGSGLDEALTQCRTDEQFPLIFVWEIGEDIDPEIPAVEMKQEAHSNPEQKNNTVPNNEITEADDFVTPYVVCNVRKGPGTKYEIISTAQIGEKLPCLDKVESDDGSGYWFKILYSGAEAYISASTATTGDHVHVPTAMPEIPATCTTGGKTGGSVCATCGMVLKAQTNIPAGHSLTHVEAKAPTKNTVGWYAYDKCSKCSYTTYQERTMKPGAWSDWSRNKVTESNTRDVETRRIYDYYDEYRYRDYFE